MSALSDTRQLLQDLPFFRDFIGPELDQVAPICRLIEGPEGYRMIRERERVRNIYFLVSGKADVIKEEIRGQRVVIATVGKGDVLGEMSLLDNEPASATIEATEAFQALAIDRVVFERLMENYPRLGHKIFKKLARIASLRLRLTSGQLAQYMVIPKEAYFVAQSEGGELFEH